MIANVCHGVRGHGGGGVHFILVEGFEARKGWIKFKYIAYIFRFVKGCTIDTMVGGGSVWF